MSDMSRQSMSDFLKNIPVRRSREPTRRRGTPAPMDRDVSEGESVHSRVEDRRPRRRTAPEPDSPRMDAVDKFDQLKSSSPYTSEEELVSAPKPHRSTSRHRQRRSNEHRRHDYSDDEPVESPGPVYSFGDDLSDSHGDHRMEDTFDFARRISSLGRGRKSDELDKHDDEPDTPTRSKFNKPLPRKPPASRTDMDDVAPIKHSRSSERVSRDSVDSWRSARRETKHREDERRPEYSDSEESDYHDSRQTHRSRKPDTHTDHRRSREPTPEPRRRRSREPTPEPPRRRRSRDITPEPSQHPVDGASDLHLRRSRDVTPEPHHRTNRHTEDRRDHVTRDSAPPKSPRRSRSNNRATADGFTFSTLPKTAISRIAKASDVPSLAGDVHDFVKTLSGTFMEKVLTAVQGDNISSGQLIPIVENIIGDEVIDLDRTEINITTFVKYCKSLCSKLNISLKKEAILYLHNALEVYLMSTLSYAADIAKNSRRSRVTTGDINLASR